MLVSNMPNTCAVATYLNVLWQRSGTSFPKTDQTVRLRKGAESSGFNLQPHLQKVTKECKNRKLVYKSSSLDHSVEHGGLQSSSSNDMKQDSYDCVICGKRFGSRGTLKNHLKIHANVLFTNEGKAVLVKTESQPEEMELEKCFVVDGLVGEDGVIGAVKSENLENDTDTVTNAEQKDLAVCIKRERDDALVYGNIEITEEVICKTEPFEMTDSLNS
ncbi:hypothetical protein SK128_026048 [Halocaridina rubra]|uniref:C2H2-type domain-containing protein n=1 Tax=Halocaridina rubra TaxID=373956 RepID=A0AAN8ZYV4_HALRR